MAQIRKLTALASVALLAGLGLTGCGDDSASNGDKTSGSAQEQSAAPAQLTAENFAERINAAQFEAGSAHMVMDISQAEVSSTGTADIVISEDPADIKMRMELEIPEAGTMEMILLGTEAYVNMGELSQNKFAKIPEEYMSELNLAQMQAQANPSSQFDAYSKALKDFTSESGEKIDGVETTKYTLVLDTAELLAASGQSDSLPEEAADALGETVSYDMYIGEDDLPRRIVMDLGNGESVIEFSNWGEDVDIVAPSADEIVELPGL